MKESRFISQGSDGKYTIDSGMPEFGYELIATLPYAYHLHKKGLLKKTISASDTQSLYFFSPEHLEVAQKRDWENVVQLETAGFPNIQIHRSQLDWDVFEPPPFQQYYENKKIVFDKPTVVITNRKNVEWRGDPINFIDDNTLVRLVDMLKDSHQIVYIDPAEFGAAYEDHFKFIQTGFGDKSGDKSNVLTFSDLRRRYPGLSVNELQCRLYAGCSRFISSNGGLGILCSYFGGENIIFSKLCRELDEEVNSFHSWYYRLSNASVSLARTEDDLLRKVEEKWVKNRPRFNVLIQTTGKPNCFHDCIRSVYDQDYGNINIYVSVDDFRNLEYVRRHRCAIVNVDDASPQKGGTEQSSCRNRKAESVHLRQLVSCVNSGYVLYLDEDSILRDSNALSQIAATLQHQQSKADIVCWRTDLGNRMVPSDKNWDNRRVENNDVSKMGVCHSVKVKPNWDSKSSESDCLARFLSDANGHVEWLDRVVSGRQHDDSGEALAEKDKSSISISAYSNIAVVLVARNAAATLERCLDTVCVNEWGDGFRVLVGINGCVKTYRVAKRLTRKYGGKVSFYNTGKQIVDTWALRQALLKKLYRRDTLLFFANTEDMFPRNFFQDVVAIYNRMVSQSGFNGALRPGIWRVDDACVESAATLAEMTDDERGAMIKEGLTKPNNADVRKLFLSGMLHSERCRSYQKLFSAYLRMETMEERYNRNTGQFKELLTISDDSFFCGFEDFAALDWGGVFNGGAIEVFDRMGAASGEMEAAMDTVWIVRVASADAGAFTTKSVSMDKTKPSGYLTALSIML